ncbi:MAG: 30S ribosomal protein S4 [Candidatus Schekmanbacteria bacterium RBG_16_38_10]|uniref:Small ribosomal subunit protein uS4 n=1 Tax=Candidatus Schekmanbacteria bacterium RBG_16_38_10 TaxID=1817879 RepID=A0A1F7RNF4_9BACT|nr:MAG: 30S ribosomal protein S4 [Candidatus Schekmanbacteria bacterium RBG_16_38_10]
MARYRESVCRHCRREGIKLFLKGEKCYTEKCTFDRKSYAPGQHGQSRRSKPSDYGMQLREKQKVKRIYGVLERQFRKYFQIADRAKGITGENLLNILERRLDNVVYRLNFSSSRKQARQLVTHGHFLVNGKKVDIPSFLVKKGDVIEVKEKSKNLSAILSSTELVKKNPPPSWLLFNTDKLEGRIAAFPNRAEIQLPINEKFIVEIYSK